MGDVLPLIHRYGENLRGRHARVGRAVQNNRGLFQNGRFEGGEETKKRIIPQEACRALRTPFLCFLLFDIMIS